jgi:hypothetical protein
MDGEPDQLESETEGKRPDANGHEGQVPRRPKNAWTCRRPILSDGGSVTSGIPNSRPCKASAMPDSLLDECHRGPAILMARHGATTEGHPSAVGAGSGEEVTVLPRSIEHRIEAGIDDDVTTNECRLAADGSRQSRPLPIAASPRLATLPIRQMVGKREELGLHGVQVLVMGFLH